MKEWKPAKWVLMIFVAISSTGIQAQQAQSQQVHAFSLQQALDYAKQNNTEVKNALLDIRIQQQTNREVTGRPPKGWRLPLIAGI